MSDAPESSGTPRQHDLSPSRLRSPLEAHGPYRGADWTPQRLMFHHNLESFAEQVGLIVALQSNGKLSQEQAYAQIRQLWKQLRQSKDALIDGQD